MILEQGIITFYLTAFGTSLYRPPARGSGIHIVSCALVGMYNEYLTLKLSSDWGKGLKLRG